MVEFRKIYNTTIKKFLLAIGAVGIPIGIGLIVLLAARGDITILDHSGDYACDGTLEDPCIAWVKFKANVDIFVYPMNDSSMLFGTDNKLKDLKVFRTWGEGLREYHLDSPCTGTWCGLSNADDTRKFSWAWRKGKEYKVYFYGYKNSPDDVIKWSFTEALDPVWLPHSADPNLVARYSCEGNFLDSSGQGNHGTQSGGVSITRGVKGRACEFDGENSYIDGGNDQSLNITGSELTLVGWIKPRIAHTGVMASNGRDSGTPGGYTIRLLSGGTIQSWIWRQSTGTLLAVTSTATCAPDQWCFIGMTFNGTNVVDYIDGARSGVSSTVAAETIYPTQFNFTIGALGYLPPNYFEFNGTIDEVRIYNRSLSATEISALYDTQKSYKIVLKTTPTQGLIDETGLVGYWKFNSEDGSDSTTAVDSSGQGNDGTVTGATLTNEGRFKEGYKFDGVNDYIDIGNDLSLKNMSSEVTVSAWAKYNAYGSSGQTYSVIAVKGAPWTFLMENPANKIRFRVTAGGVDSNAADPVAHKLNQWYHFVGTYDGTNIKMYKDGVQVGITARNGSLGVTDTVAKIGTYQGTNNNFNGTLDEIRIYNRSLSATEVANLYNGSKSNYISIKTTPTQGLTTDLTDYPYLTSETGLVGWWKLNGDALDSSGEGNDGTVTGATSTNDGRWDGAYEFDGITSDGYINISDLDLTNVTISAWVKQDSAITDAYIGIITKQRNYNLYTQNRELGYYDATPGWEGSGQYLTLGQWYHVALTIDADSSVANDVMYLNGVGVSTTNFSQNSNDVVLWFGLGEGGIGSTQHFNGTIDEVRLYNRSLSASEVQELYLSKGLVGHWKMDASVSNSTSTLDSSGYGNTGTLTGAVLTNEGRFKEGYKFDGSGDYINYGNIDSTNINQNNITVSFWANLDSINEFVYPISKRISGTTRAGWMIQLSPTNKFRMYYGNSTTNIYPASTYTPVTNVWTHYVAVIKYGDEVDFFVDGESKGTQSLSSIGGDVSNTYNFVVGGYSDPIGLVYGTIDEVRIYNRALTATEVAGLYNGTRSNYISLKTVSG